LYEKKIFFEKKKNISGLGILKIFDNSKKKYEKSLFFRTVSVSFAKSSRLLKKLFLLLYLKFILFIELILNYNPLDKNDNS
jgi:hypothetical protein